MSVISTFISFFWNYGDGGYRKTEILMVLLIYPFCFAISPFIMIAWVYFKIIYQLSISDQNARVEV